jgi:hypothetical protein
LLTLLHQYHSELVSPEQYVELFGQIDGMTAVAETDLFVFGSGIVQQLVLALEIDGTIFVEDCPNTIAAKYLIAFVIGLIYMFQDDRGFWS